MGSNALRYGQVTSSKGPSQPCPSKNSTGHVVSVPGVVPANTSSWVATSKSDGITELKGLDASTHPI